MCTTGLLMITVACSSQSPPCTTTAGTEDTYQGDAGCLITDGRRVLIIRHHPTGKIGLPGGTALQNESAQCTAHRETWEEMGLNVTVGRHLVRLDTPFHVYDCRLGREDLQRESFPVPMFARSEVQAIRWVDPTELSADDWRFPTQLNDVLMLTGRDAISKQPE